MSKICGIYKITSPSGKVYIGQSENIVKRKSCYRRYHCENQIKIHRSLIKYGWENHTFEIIEECLKEDLSEREGYWQDFYDAIYSGLNCRRVPTKDSPGYTCEETIENNSNAAKYGGKTIVKKQPRVYGKGKDCLNSKVIENTITKAIYYGVNEASEAEGIPWHTLRKYLNGDVYNKTPLRYIKEKQDIVDIPRTGKLILDQQTGIFYYNGLEAAEACGVKYGTLRSMLNGRRKNKTSLIYV